MAAIAHLLRALFSSDNLQIFCCGIPVIIGAIVFIRVMTVMADDKDKFVR